MGGAAAVVSYVPVQTVLLGAAKEATRVSQNLRANEWIGICAHHNGPGWPHGVQQTMLAFGYCAAWPLCSASGSGIPARHRCLACSPSGHRQMKRLKCRERKQAIQA